MRRLRPGAAFGADLIAGFPTETEEMFQQTMNLVDEAGLSMLHVFPFSARAGTPAARMPQVDKSFAKDRARRLRVKGEVAIAARHANLVGTTQTILVEKNGLGRTECFAPVTLDAQAMPGAFVTARITGASVKELRAAA